MDDTEQSMLRDRFMDAANELIRHGLLHVALLRTDSWIELIPVTAVKVDGQKVTLAAEDPGEFQLDPRQMAELFTGRKSVSDG